MIRSILLLLLVFAVAPTASAKDELVKLATRLLGNKRRLAQTADGVASEGSLFVCSPNSCAAISARKRDMIVDVHSWISTSV